MPYPELDDAIDPEAVEAAARLEELLKTPTDFEPEELDPDSLEAGDEVPDEDDNDDDDDEIGDNPPDDLADDTELVEESSDLPNEN